ncbi:MAG TPA: hypothetical protein VGK67_33645 [Myxococcales bacterium]|jgi:hypothetical protein
MISPIVAFSCLLLGAAPETSKVALMPLPEGEGVSEKTALAITEAITSEVRRVPGVQLITQQEIGSLVGLERQKTLMGCGNDSCLAELGGALGVDKMVTGNINKLGETWLFNLKLSDVKKSKIVAQADRRLRKAAIDDLLEQIPAMVGELFGAAPTKGPMRAVEPPKPEPTATGTGTGTGTAAGTGTGTATATGTATGTAAAAPTVKHTDNGADVPVADGAKLDDLKVVTDGAGHYLAFPPKFASPGARCYSGDGKAFHAMRAVGGGSDPKTGVFSHVLWDPRFRDSSGLDASFDHPGPGKYSLSCGKKVIEFKELAPAEAKELVKGAKFFEQRWRRKSHLLARDDEGRYLYVDEGREPVAGRRDFHFFMGTKGKMQAVELTDVVSDPTGEIFTTSAGRLKRSLSDGDGRRAEWIEGQKRTQVRLLALENEAQLIYTALGVYAGERLGLPCDALVQ